MTLSELNRHFELVSKLEQAGEMLQILRKAGDFAAEIADVEASIAQAEEKVKASEERIRAFILTIPDDRTRLIFQLRFLRGLAWKEVAQALGRYVTEKSVSETCYRYLRNMDADGDPEGKNAVGGEEE